jgi:hypothetical protein
MISLIVDIAKQDQKERLWKVLKKLKPVQYVFEIKQHREQRSISQNRYYFGVIVKILSQELGYFPDEIHELLKQKFRPKEVILKATGESFKVGRSTTEDDTYDAEQYYEQIRIWALQELDILIPLPNEKI